MATCITQMGTKPFRGLYGNGAIDLLQISESTLTMYKLIGSQCMRTSGNASQEGDRIVDHDSKVLGPPIL